MATAAQELAALTAEVNRLAGLVTVLTLRVEETLAAAFPYNAAPTTPGETLRKLTRLDSLTAPARQARRRGDRPGHLRSVNGGESWGSR